MALIIGQFELGILQATHKIGQGSKRDAPTACMHMLRSTNTLPSMLRNVGY